MGVLLLAYFLVSSGLIARLLSRVEKLPKEFFRRGAVTHDAGSNLPAFLAEIFRQNNVCLCEVCSVKLVHAIQTDFSHFISSLFFIYKSTRVVVHLYIIGGRPLVVNVMAN